jgi:predicted transcriptional regulator
MRKKSEVLHLRVSSDTLIDIKRIAKAERRTDSFVARDLIEESLKWRKLHPSDQKAIAAARV